MTLLEKRPGVWEGVKRTTFMSSNWGLWSVIRYWIGSNGRRMSRDEELGWSGFNVILGR